MAPETLAILGPRRVEDRDYGVSWVSPSVSLSRDDLQALTSIISRVRNWREEPESFLARVQLPSGIMGDIRFGGAEFLESLNEPIAPGGRYLQLTRAPEQQNLAPRTLIERAFLVQPGIIIRGPGPSGSTAGAAQTILDVLTASPRKTFASHPVADVRFDTVHGFAVFDVVLDSVAGMAQAVEEMTEVRWPTDQSLPVETGLAGPLLSQILEAQGLAGLVIAVLEEMSLKGNDAFVAGLIEDFDDVVAPLFSSATGAQRTGIDWADIARACVARASAGGETVRALLIAAAIAPLKDFEATGPGALASQLAEIDPAPVLGLCTVEERVGVLAAMCARSTWMVSSGRQLQTRLALSPPPVLVQWMKVLADDIAALVPVDEDPSVEGLLERADLWRRQFEELPAVNVNLAHRALRAAIILLLDAGASGPLLAPMQKVMRARQAMLEELPLLTQRGASLMPVPVLRQGFDLLCSRDTGIGARVAAYRSPLYRRPERSIVRLREFEALTKLLPMLEQRLGARAG